MARRIGFVTYVGSVLVQAMVSACGGQANSGTHGGALGGTAGTFAVANSGDAGVPSLASGGGEMGPVSGPSTGANAGYGGTTTVPSTTLAEAGGSNGTTTGINLPFVAQNPSGEVDKVDILFMIDNSLGMGEKQLILQAAVPHLLRRLTNPNCIDPQGVLPPTTMADPLSPCAAGLSREAPPARDIHLGIVTSSLGDFGGDLCPLPEEDPQGPANSPHNAAQNDHAWLLGALPRNAGALSNQFLAWGPADANQFGSSLDSKISEFRSFIAAATELGCGYEMSLEAWYRFLVDPKPPTDVSPPLDPTGKSTTDKDVRGPIDQNILNQRRAFLRPDSLVAVFMLTDENDCSFRDDTYGWVPMTYGQGFRMWRGSSICKDDPNNECCYSCLFDQDAPQKCRDMDTGCRMTAAEAKLAAAEDDLNVRCRQMKRRFGYDFLFPPSRYVNALTQIKLCPDQDYGDLDCECAEAKRKGIPCNPGTPVDNPLYVNLNPSVVPTGPTRSGPELVFLTGVVGVPWQDLAADPNSALLTYQRATKLRWDRFAPRLDEDYSSAVLGDPLMAEAFDPRPGLPGPDSPRSANPINGHEWNTFRKDVQSACIFSLETELVPGKTATRVCDLTKECGRDDGSVEYKKCNRRFTGCACTPTPAGATAQSPLDPSVTHSPLCQDSQNNFGSTQYFARAQPGLRELQVLRGFHEATLSDNAIVGSICPKDLTAGNQASPGWGYNPAVVALVDQLQQKLGRACLPRALPIQTDGTVACSAVEAIPRSVDPKWCSCADNMRTPVSPDVEVAIRAALGRDALCGRSGLPDCADFCFCGLNQLTASTVDGNRCLNEPNAEKTTTVPGFCYVDPAHGSGSAQAVSGCASSARQLIRIVGNSNSTNQYLAAPAPGQVYVACSAAAVSP